MVRLIPMFVVILMSMLMAAPFASANNIPTLGG